MLSGSHDQSLINALDSVFLPGNSSGLSGFNTRLTDSSALGRNIAVVGAGMSNFDPGAALNTLLSSVATGSASLTALQAALTNKTGITVTATRDLPNDLQIDVQFNVTQNVVVPINATFGANFSEPGSVTMAVTLHESLTLGAYWDGHTSAAVAYVSAANDSIQISGVVSSYTFQSYPAVAQLGFVEFDTPTTPSSPITDQNQTGNKILSTAVIFSPTFTFALNEQPPVDSTEAADRLTFAQLTSVDVADLVNTQVTQPASSTLTVGLTSPLVPSAHQIVFTWPDINTPDNVSSTLATDPSLTILNQWQSISPATFSMGLDEAAGDLTAAATTNVNSTNSFDVDLPLINESFNDIADFSEYYTDKLTSYTDAVIDSQGNVTEPFQTDQTLLSLIQSHNIVGDLYHISESASGSQLLFHLTMGWTRTSSIAAYLPQLNLSSLPNMNILAEINTDITFGFDGVSGQFFVQASSSTPQVSASISATGSDVIPTGYTSSSYPYPAQLGFLGVDLGGSLLQMNAAGTITLVDPQTDSPASPGIITATELASGPQPSGPILPIPATASVTGTASANIDLGPDNFAYSQNPALTPATISIAWPDVSQPANFTNNSSGLTPYIGFNNLATASMDSALAELPTLLNSLSDSSQLGQDLAFFGSSLGSTITLGSLFQTDLANSGLVGTNSYNNIQRLLQQLKLGFGTNNVTLTNTSDGVAIDISLTQQYNGNANWTASHPVGQGELQASGTVPVTATFHANLDLGIVLTSAATPANQFYLVGGTGALASGISGTILVNTTYNGPATIGPYTVQIINGTVKIGATDAQGNILPGQPATFSIPFGNGSAGQRLALPSTLSNPDSLYGPSTFSGAIKAVFPIGGLPNGKNTSQVELDWSNFGKPSTLTATPTDLGTLSTAYNSGPMTDGLDALITLVNQWASSSILNTDIPFIDEPLSKVIDFSGITKTAIQQIENAAKNAASADAQDTAIQNVALGAGITITKTANDNPDNPSGSVFEYTLSINETPSASVPFALGGGLDSLFSLKANITVSAAFTANIVFGFDAADGFYVIGGNDPANPQISLKGTINANLPQFTAGGFGVIGFGLENGSATMNMGMGLNLVPTGDNGNKISKLELATDGLSIAQPTLNTATGALSLTLGAHIGSGGPGISTTFTADWDPTRDQAIEFGPTHSTDPTDGFSAINIDIGEFINDLVGPVLSYIKKYNPLPQQLIDALNYKIPLINQTPADILGDYTDNKELGLLVQIADVITKLTNLPTNNKLDLSQFMQGDSSGTSGDTGTPDGQAPTDSGSVGADIFQEFKDFASTLESEFDIQLPALDDPQKAIVSTLLGKPVDLIVFDPGQIDLKASYETPEISFPLFSIGIASVNAFFSAGLSAELFANIDIGLSTRGLLGQGIGGGTNLLDGFFIGDTDQYQVGVKLEGHITVGGEVDLFDAIPVVKLDGQFGPYGEVGARVNTLVVDSKGNPVPDPMTGLYEIAGYNGNAPGNGRAYLDQIEYIAANYGPLCAVMPGGQFGLQLTVNATVGISPFSFSYQFLSQQFPIANYDYPCVPIAADLATVQGNALVMHADPTTSGYTVSASVQYDNSSGSSVPIGVAIVESNSSNIYYEDFPLSELAGVNTIVLEGSNGDDTFNFDPKLSLLPGTPIQYLKIETNSGNDVVDLSGLTQANSNLLGVTITGGNGNDKLKGTYAPDVINVGSGTNYVFTGTGNAVVYETSGDDTIDGADGNIIVHAGSGTEKILLGNGDDVVYAGSGPETIILGDGMDLITAGTGKDTITVGDGNDEVHGDSGGSTITTGAGQDIIYGGIGNDSITAGGGNDFIDPGTGTDKVNGGTGHTLLAIHSDSNQTLTNNSVTLGGNGKTTFSHISSISLNGGPGSNTFDVSAWTGSSVQINGGGGTDTIASTDDTNFTLTDSSLTRSDGATFALSGISNANLTGGSSDNTFDVTGWHGSGTLSGNGGTDTLLASDLIGATLGNALFSRSGALDLDLVAISQANLTTSPFGNTQINASAFSGAVALYGQGNGNILIGGSGSDYLVGGAGSNNHLIGNGAIGNQLVGGTGSSDILTGGPGQSLLVGSTGGHDTITTSTGASHIYTPGGNDTINAQTGGAIIYSNGSGNVISTGSSTTDQILHPGDQGTTSADFAAPPSDPWSFPALPTIAANTLPTGPNTQGQWIEYASSASGTGLSNSNASALEPSIVVDSTGDEFVAWSDNRTGGYKIYLAERTPTGWIELAGSAHGGGISNSTTDARRPSLTLDASGNPVVAWTQINGSSSTIKVADFIAGVWTAVGSPLSTGHADDAKLVNTSAGLVAAWLDTSAGAANIYVRRFDGANWNELTTGSASSAGISNSTVTIPTFTLATDGTKIAIAWTQSNTSAGQSVYLLQYANSSWSALSGSASNNGISSTFASSMPTLAYSGGSLYAAWAANTDDRTNIVAAYYTGLAWAPISVSTPASAGIDQISRGAASDPVLSSNGSSLDLVWVEDRLSDTPDQAVAIYANRLSGSAFVAQLPGDSSFDGILGRSTSLSQPASLALALDSSGHPFVAWGDSSAGSSQIYTLADTLDVHKIIYVNDSLSVTDSYTTAAGSASNNGLTPDKPFASIQTALNVANLQPGDVILVDSGTYAGFSVGPSDNGVLILGSPNGNTIISGAVSLTNVQGMTLENLDLTGSATITGGSSIDFLNDIGGSLAKLAISQGGSVNIAGASAVLLSHDSFASVNLTGATSNITIVHNSLPGTGLSLSGSSTNLLVSQNNLATLAISSASQGSITQNNITGNGLIINALVTGSIDHNLIHSATVGVTYSVGASLNANQIFDNKTGILDTVNSNTTGLGFMPGSSPNHIFANGIGVNLTGLMQDQLITANNIGVTGSGVLGGTSLDTANLIASNSTGIKFTGTIQYNRIAENNVSIAVQNNQLISHNLIYNNAGPNLETNGASSVEIINNTFSSPDQTNIQVDNASINVQILNNILSTGGGYDINVADNSRSGFFSDYNDLFTTGSGKIVHYLLDFTDILDWQDNVAIFDLHSIGTTVTNPTAAQPQFVNPGFSDFAVFPAAAGLRPTSPTVGTGDPNTDLALPVGYTNLLTNPSFESGVAGWTVNPGGSTITSNPAAFDGSFSFYPGSVATGFAQQTLSLLSAGYTASQLDAGNLDISFGGRIRSANETPADQGQLLLTFLDGVGNPIGNSTLLSATNVNDRWELVGSRVHIPAGALSVTYRFQSPRQTGTTDDSYLDGAFLYVVSNTTSTDIGAYGNTAASLATPVDQSIHLQSPDLYVNWTLNQSHNITWSTFGNTGDVPVKIDLYQIIAGTLTFLQTISPSTADNGVYPWIPQNSNLSYGTYNLVIQVSLVGNSAIHDKSTETFTIPENGNSYYVNDSSTLNSQYTSAPGSNRATGKLSTAPLPLLTTVLRTYSLGGTDTVYIDTGFYQHFAPVELSGNPAVGNAQGVTLQGPTTAGDVAIISALGFSSPAVIDINNAAHVTINNLTLTNGDYGLWVRNASSTFTSSFVTVTNNVVGGLRIEADSSSGVTLDHITAATNHGIGIYVGGQIISLTNSTSYSNTGDGFDLANSGAAVLTDDIAHNNGSDGFYISNFTVSTTTIFGNANLALGLGNQSYNNAGDGINTNGLIAINGNTFYGQSAVNSVGINLVAGATASENIVHDNYNGIIATTGTITFNRSYNNLNIGIEGDAGATITGNEVYGNFIGIKSISAPNSSTGPYILNNLVYNNTAVYPLLATLPNGATVPSQEGIWLIGGNAAQLNNNTVYQPTGDAIHLDGFGGGVIASNIQIENNILWTQHGYDISVDPTSENGFHSDYNDLYFTATGAVGLWENVARTTLATWLTATNNDSDSLSVDPLFVNAPANDFHEQSTTGSFVGGSLAPILGPNNLPIANPGSSTPQPAESPAIDRGDASFSYSHELTPNGGFINIGAFGNTSQASLSPTSYVLVLKPIAGQNLIDGQSSTITWRTQDTAGTVNIDLLFNGSDTLIAAGAPNTGTYNWSLPSNLTPGSGYVIQITRNAAPTAIGDSAPFNIEGPITQYYVNVASTGGTFTTAAGSDSNSGTDPAHPKATIQALLTAYQLGVGDTIFVDQGTYNLSNNIILTAANSGLTLQGVPGGSTILDRLNLNTGSFVFDLQTVANVTIKNFTIIGGYDGINASYNNGSTTGLTISGSNFHGSEQAGINLSNNFSTTVVQTNDLITGNTFHDMVNVNGTAGVLSTGDQITLSNNTVYNTVNGLYVQNASGITTVISGNTVYNNYYGINAANALITGNIAYSNTNTGILATQSSTVTGNTTHNNTTIGINFSGTATGNISYANPDGIYINGDSTASDNLVYNNTTAGIVATNGAIVIGNVAYGNAIGFSLTGGPSSADGGPTIKNNLLYNNVAGGIFLTGGDHTPILNNTIYQPSGYALQIASSQTTDVQVRDNIFEVAAGLDVIVGAAAEQNVTFDYNDFFTTGSGQVGQWNGVNYPTLAGWQSASGLDANSLSVDPLFINPAANDFHVQSLYGSNHSGTLAPILNTTTGLPQANPGISTTDNVQSPIIDRGAPTDPYSLEPTPNGGYVNLGAYGNTAQASLSPAHYLLIINPAAGLTIATGQPTKITWRDEITNLSAGASNTDTIQLMQGNTVVLSFNAPDTGTYTWTPPLSLSSGVYQLQITRTDSTALSSTGPSFNIAAFNGIYYVNGSSTAGTFTTAAGSDSNSGLDPAHPKATLSAILNSYTLQPGNTIMVDQGTYNLSTNLNLTSVDSGITIQGVPNATILNRGNLTAGAYVFDLQGATNLTLKNLNITGAYYGVNANFQANSDGLTVTGSNFYADEFIGIDLQGFNGNATITNNTFFNMLGANGLVGFSNNYASNVTVTGNTVHDMVTGIYISTQNGITTNDVINNNTVYGNTTGISISAGNNGPFTINNNTIYDNYNINLSVNATSAIMTGNSIYQDGGAGTKESTNEIGVYISNGTFTGNSVYGNMTGINIASGQFGNVNVTNNNIHDNTLTGVTLADGVNFSGNTVSFNGGWGIQAGLSYGSNTVISNNLVYSNNTGGIYITGSYTTDQVLNNTVYQLKGDALKIDGTLGVPSGQNYSVSLNIENNILWTQGASSYAIDISDSAENYLTSNYNDLYATGSAQIAQMAGHVFTTLSAWVWELGLDANSISADPQFTSVAGKDFSIQYSSPTIDAGDPTSAFSAEPSPTGGRINLGHTGNTASATPSPARSVQILSPSTFQKLEVSHNYAITFHTAGLPANTTATVELSLDNGSSWTLLATGVSINASGNGSLSWTPTIASNTALLRIIATGVDVGAAISAQPFTIAPSGVVYYVNDSSTAGDSYTTAIGNNANDGKTPATPMASIEAVINSYHPGVGATIEVDAGTYTLFHAIILPSADTGLTITGPLTSAAIINRNNTTSGDYAFSFYDGANNITLSHFSITGADIGINAPYKSTIGNSNITLSSNTIYSNATGGILTGFNTNWVITNNVIHDNSAYNSSYGIYLQGVTGSVTGNTVYNEPHYGILFSSPSSTSTPAANFITNNTVYGTTDGIWADGITVSNNLVHDNSAIGIYADQGTIATGNTVWRQTATNAVGIQVSSAVVSGNSVFGNYNGILMTSYGTISGNRIYSNTNYGLLMQNINGTYGYLSPIDAGDAYNNLIYANSVGGISISNSGPASLFDNTIYQLIGDAINVTGSTNLSTPITIRNNVLWVQAGYDLDIASGSQTGVISDYNDLYHVGNNASVASYIGTKESTLAAWQSASNQDAHSTEANPLFVDPTGADASLGYNPTANSGNGYNGGPDDNFLLSAGSPAINTGLSSASPAADLLGYTRAHPDMGAYAYRGTVTAPPTVSTVTTGSGSSQLGISQITLTFSEPLNDVDANASSLYTLAGAGLDGLFGTGDDLVYSLTPSYTPGSQQVLLTVNNGTLPAGSYRLTIISNSVASLHNLAGVPLDGDANGTPGGNYVTTFSTGHHPGDTNNDGKVDLTDLNNVLNNFGSTTPGNPGDDNGDGKVDLTDLNNVLNNFGAATTPNKPGDTNGDGKVDLTDLNNVLNNFGSTTPGNPGDTNNDGKVDLTDLNNVLNNFGTVYAPGSLSISPQSSSLEPLPPVSPDNVQADPTPAEIVSPSQPDTSDDAQLNPSPTFIIAPQPHLVFVNIPTHTVAGGTLSTVIVYAEDSSNHLITTDHSSVKLSSNAKLLGTTTAKLKNGKAIFSNLSIQKAGSYQLDATDALFTSAISNPISITSAAAATIQFLHQPANIAKHTPFTLQVEVTDQFGNKIATNSKITLLLATYPPGTAFTGTIVASLIDGVATFDNLSFTHAGQYTLLVKFGTKLSKLSSKITVH
ncbi:MAG TPA: right-handed parallel beta-helix repeat-containing protein [Tepidisphaeraceae bacterium]|nr:right-handed parallel beta-helix repeat-containing protein [Tepidisphaeraceae bacterium]